MCMWVVVCTMQTCNLARGEMGGMNTANENNAKATNSNMKFNRIGKGKLPVWPQF